MKKESKSCGNCIENIGVGKSAMCYHCSSNLDMHEFKVEEKKSNKKRV